MPLIPALREIRERIERADASARSAVLEILEVKEGAPERIAEPLRRYIQVKYMLERDDMDTEDIIELGKRSLERVKERGNIVIGMDVSPHCGSAGSSVHKKVLLLISLNKALAISLTPKERAKCDSVQDLAALIAKHLKEK